MGDTAYRELVADNRFGGALGSPEMYDYHRIIAVVSSVAINGGGIEAHHLGGNGSGSDGSDDPSEFFGGYCPGRWAVCSCTGANYHHLRPLVQRVGRIAGMVEVPVVQVVRRYLAL